jgi:Methyltransferase domain
MSTVDLLALPFDQYQRYMVVAQIADLVRTHLAQPQLQVLDVGGFFRTLCGEVILPLIHFLPRDQVVAVDLVPERLSGYILSDGRSLPFGDKTFDLVASCDTLEHVPPGGRSTFVDELLRVARHYLVLIAPFDDESNRLAECIVYEYLTAQGLHHAPFREHRELGLPDADALRASLAKSGLAFVDFADGYLHHWLPMMLIKHTPGQSPVFHVNLDRYYNKHISPTDRREPAYRRVFVVAQPGNEELLPAIANSLQPVRPPAPAPDSELVTNLMHALNLGRTTALADALREAERQLADMRPQLAALEVETMGLRQTVAAYERGRFMRFMRQVARWRNKLGI